MTKQEYRAKLQHPYWQKKRLEIMYRDNFTCQSCGSKTTILNVHHKKYSGDPWEVDNKFLVTLCEDCHELEGDMMKEYSELFIDSFKGSPFLADDLRELAAAFSSIELQAPRSIFIKALAYAIGHPDGQSALINAFNEKINQTRNG